METAAVIVPAHVAYMHIPTNELRSFADGMFPSLAKNSVADVAQGFGHRYVAGHDLLLDVPRTFAQQGLSEGTKHAGHIVLTDFITKAGIPIPGFSQSGMGQFLEQAGIHRGWLQVNLCDAGLGIIAISEGSSDFIQALNGTLEMSGATFFDTFAEGGVEIYWAITTQNPILLAGGIENIAAGALATYNSVSMHIDPLVFFGSAGTSALIGFALAYGLAGKSVSEATIDAAKSGAIGAFFAISPAFGFGALAGFAAFSLGGKLGKIHNESMSDLLRIDNHTLQLLVDEMCIGNVDLADFLERADTCATLNDDSPIFSTEYFVLNDEVMALPASGLQLDSDSVLLPESNQQLDSNARTLPDDNPILVDWYRTVLSSR